MADAQGATGEFNEPAKGSDVGSLGSTNLHCESLKQAT
ncbi:hypothetical protein J2X06_003466 [Lysobacter niastensis]|uniref:Uncharacterized protein n=1 Tax=Lysobacter niastensis TaxID=380629 RepID=A0ABU1WFW1_9GAMM|nr:hypothetical protein [Lysobacter niastensis]